MPPGNKIAWGRCDAFRLFYRSPTKTTTSDENNKKLNQLFHCLSEKKYSHKLLLGDFNYKHINWTTWSTPCNEESAESMFIEAVKDSFLHQHVEKATRSRGNDDPSMLDLVFTDEAMQISELNHHSPLGKSDHSVVTFNFHCYLDYGKQKDRLNYTKGDYVAMRNDLVNTDWAGEFVREGKDKNVDELWNTLKTKLTDLTSKFVPKITISNQPQWKDKRFSDQ